MESWTGLVLTSSSRHKNTAYCPVVHIMRSTSKNPIPGMANDAASLITKAGPGRRCSPNACSPPSCLPFAPHPPAFPEPPRVATHDETTPPIDIYGIHGRYANATYTAASKNDTLSLVETELTALKSSIESSPDRRQYLENLWWIARAS